MNFPAKVLSEKKGEKVREEKKIIKMLSLKLYEKTTWGRRVAYFLCRLDIVFFSLSCRSRLMGDNDMELHEKINLKSIYKHRNELFPGSISWWACKVLFPDECKEIEKENKTKEVGDE